MLGAMNSAFVRTGMHSATSPDSPANIADPNAPTPQADPGVIITNPKKIGKAIAAVQRNRAPADGLGARDFSAPVPTSDFGGA